MKEFEEIDVSDAGEHRELSRFKHIHSGDCYIYKIICVCGKVVGAWTPEEAEAKLEIHLKEES